MYESNNIKEVSLTSIFSKLIEVAQENNILDSGKNVMELPLYFTATKPFMKNLKNFYSSYNNLISNKKLEDYIRKETIDIVEKFTKDLEDTVEEYLNGNIASAYNCFTKAISPIIKKLPITQVPKDTQLYRMRAEIELTDPKDFYHLPFDKIHLSKSERFSIEGYPCLYLGYSKRVCELEISNGSLAKFSVAKPLENILDLTLNQSNGEKAISDVDLVTIYPLIASCYIVPFYCRFKETECRPEQSFFREEYIIPQLLTLYLKENNNANGSDNINGIIYYSVKDPKLDVKGAGENDLRNIVLFTKRDEDSNKTYDGNLINKFTITT